MTTDILNGLAEFAATVLGSGLVTVMLTWVLARRTKVFERIVATELERHKAKLAKELEYHRAELGLNAHQYAWFMDRRSEGVKDLHGALTSMLTEHRVLLTTLLDRSRLRYRDNLLEEWLASYDSAEKTFLQNRLFLSTEASASARGLLGILHSQAERACRLWEGEIVDPPWNLNGLLSICDEMYSQMESEFRRCLHQRPVETVKTDTA